MDYEIIEQVSNRERIVKVKNPIGRYVFSHQFFDGRKWRQCTHCGDNLKIPSGPVTNIEHVRKYCISYRSGAKKEEFVK